MEPEPRVLATFRAATLAMIEHVSGHDLASFEADRKTRSAVLFEIVIQGECAKRLSFEFRNRWPSVPWTQIAGMRDRVVHSFHFHDIDLPLVWNVAQAIAPSLLVEIDRIIASESE